MRLLACVLAVSLLGLAGCGGPATSSTSAAATPLDITGNWEVTGLPAAGSITPPTPVAAFFGSLASSGGTVTGVMRVLPALSNPCIAITQNLAVTGTISNASLLTLKVPLAGGVATITAQLGATLQTITPSSYTIDGGACAMPPTASGIAQFAPLTGTYTGTLTENLPTSGLTAAVTATLVQSPTPNSDGMFPFSGSVTLTGTCAATFTFTNGLITGNNVNGFYAVTYPPPPGILRGATTPAATTIQADLSLYTSACTNTFFYGTLTRQ